MKKSTKRKSPRNGKMSPERRGRSLIGPKNSILVFTVSCLYYDVNIFMFPFLILYFSLALGPTLI